MSKLALLGGDPAINHTLNSYNSMGNKEAIAVQRVMKSGNLSSFIGAWCEEFYGGVEIKAFEQEWASRFSCKHAISVNSNTSGLIAAMGAIGVSPGDEIIVPPYSMSATVMAPLFYGGIPVFVDLEPETFCLDVEKVKQAITPKTKAILVVDLFGHPAQLQALRALADKNNIYLIEDAAQAPLATEFGRLAGTVGHIGIFSFNYHKHIHTGEGGMCCTDDDELAMRLSAIRNHGENIVNQLDIVDPTNLIGFNFRMTELSAAIGREQLKKLEHLVSEREAIANNLTAALSDLPGLTAPKVRDDCRHVYYEWIARYDKHETEVSREVVAKALMAEGVPIWEGYVEPLYMLPAFQRRIAIGGSGWPFTLSEQTYEKGICPVTENLYENEVLEFCICCFELNQSDQDAVIKAFQKVFENLNELKGLSVNE